MIDFAAPIAQLLKEGILGTLLVLFIVLYLRERNAVNLLQHQRLDDEKLNNKEYTALLVKSIETLSRLTEVVSAITSRKRP